MPTTNSIRVTLKIRNDTAQAWLSKNPILSEGEFGLETDTLLLKIGDGSSQWTGLRYLNKLDSQYLTYNNSGEITFSGYMADLVGSVITTSGGTITGPLYITRDPVGQTDAANKKYVDVAIAGSGHLTREIVQQLPTPQEANEHTIYMILDSSSSGADKYKEYMLIGGQMVQTGDTSVDLKSLITGAATENHLVGIAQDGSLVDSGVAISDVGRLTPATRSQLGGVMASDNDNYIDVDASGFMTLNRVSTSLLYVPLGDELIINGGNA